jgi:hypothetical protein
LIKSSMFPGVSVCVRPTSVTLSCGAKRRLLLRVVGL